MSDIARLIGSTENHEGFRPRTYLDSKNLWSFALGRCLETNPLTGAEYKVLLDRGWLSMTISRQGADWLTQLELEAIEKQLAHDYAEFWPFIGNARQNVLIEMAYQMGIDGLRGFPAMLAAVRAGNWDMAKHEALDSQWHRKDSPKRAEELAEQLRTGEFAS